MPIRPQIPSIDITRMMSAEENFQTKVLRPIIKMKSEILLAHFKNYVATKNIKWNSLSDRKKLAYVESIFKSNQPFRSELRGILIGCFTLDEYTQYSENQREINKRIIQIIMKRIIDHLKTLSI